ncbi:DUF4097 family beta strand repeat-containing protein [Actinomycetota bacterium Odt1-20B]
MLTFDTPAPVSAVVEIPAGHIRFIAADRADTTVEVSPADSANSRDVQAAERTEVACADGVLRIESRTKKQILGPSGSVEVAVHLPTGSRVEVKSGGAGFHGTGRLGDVVVDGAQRQFTVEEAESLRLVVTDGDVKVGRLHGPAQISTARGDIHVTEAARGTVSLTTGSGDISIGAAAGVSAALTATTGYGRVSNALKNDGAPALDIHATTAHGDIAAHSL